MADVLVVATGIPHLIKDNMVKEGAIVIDVGMTRVKDKLVGDVDTENVDTSYRDATIVDPSTMTAVSGTFTLQD
jgi:5,10-methylene-tetrahydrofolate dehydrogenase/methenyl tetrahydrofolate cyclohydrolase